MEVTGLGVHIDPTGAQLGAAQVNASLDSIAARGRIAINSLDSGFTRLRGTIFGLRGAIAGLTAALSLGLIMREFSSFERALIGVGKTTDLAGEQLQNLGRQVQEISRTVPLATTELLAITQAAGQLGVKGTDNLVRFTATVGKLGLASNLAGEEAATALARILIITGTSIGEVDRLGATIVRLGNNFATTERDIANVAQEVAKATAAFSQFGVTAADVLGIATAMQAIGVEAEAGRTAILQAFQSINAAVRQGGDEMRVLQEVTGQTAAALRQTFFTDADAVFTSFIEGLGAIGRAGGDTNAVLVEFGIASDRVNPILQTMAIRSEVLADSMAQANDEWVKKIALDKEAAVAATSFSAQMRIFANAIDEAAVELGRELAPVILDVINGMRDFLIAAKESGQIKDIAVGIGDAFRFIADNIGFVIVGMGALIGMQIGAAFGPLGAAIGTIAGAFGAWGAATAIAASGTDDLVTAAVSSTVKFADLQGILSKTNEELKALGENSLTAAIASTEQQMAATINLANEMVVLRNRIRSGFVGTGDEVTIDGVKGTLSQFTVEGAMSNDPENRRGLGLGNIADTVGQVVELDNQVLRLTSSLQSLSAEASGTGGSSGDGTSVADAFVDMSQAIEDAGLQLAASRIGEGALETERAFQSARDELLSWADANDIGRQAGESLADAMVRIEGAAGTTTKALALQKLAHDGITESLEAQVRAWSDVQDVMEGIRSPTQRYIDEQERIGELVRNHGLDAAAAAEHMRQFAEDTLASTERVTDLTEEAGPMQRAFENAATGIQNAFTDAFESIFENGFADFDNFKDQVLGIMRRMAAEIATLLVFQPVVSSVLTSFGGGGFAQQLVGGSGVSAGGTGGGGGFSLPSLPGRGGGGILDMLNNFGGSLGFASSPSAGIVTAASAGPGAVGPHVLGSVPGAGSASGSAGFFGSGATLGGTLGAAGLGFMGGSLLAGAIGGNQTGGGIGGALGAGIGFAVGGPVGGLIGGTAGSLFGSFLGGGKSVGPNAAARIGGSTNGQFVLGGTGADNGGELAGVVAEANRTIDFLNAFMERYDLSIGNPVASVLPGRNFIGQGSAASRGFTTGQGFVSALLKGGGITGDDPIINNALRASSASNVEENIGIAQALVQLLSGETSEGLTQAEQALEALNLQFDQLAGKAEEFGVSMTDFETVRANAIQALTDGFDESIALQIRVITDPIGAAFEQLASQQEIRLREAEALGADLVEVERLALLERNALIAEFTQAANDNIEGLLRSLTGEAGSPLAPLTVLGNAEERFNSLIASAQGGDIAARNELASAAANLIDVSREVFASAPEFFQRFDFVVATLQNVLGSDVGIPGFATGGSFTVGGAGPADSSVFRARVSPGERITFQTPHQQANDDQSAQALNHIAAMMTRLVEQNEDLAGQVAALRHENASLNSRLERVAAATLKVA